MKTITIRNIPQWSVCYIEYKDDNGLTTEDKEQVDNFLLDLQREGWQLNEPIKGSENAFCRYPLFGLACPTVDYTANKIEKKEYFKTKEQKESFTKHFHFAN